MADDLDDEARTFRKWNGELEYALKDEKYKRWLDRSEKIVQRYRDERKTTTAEFGRRRYNILWSNVQTLAPAVYGKMPKPIAERRFLDRDPAARLGSLMLERTLSFQMDTCGFHEATDKAVLDYLLPGMGQIWLRYEPEFESAKVEQENTADDNDDPDDDDADGEPVEKLTFERVCFDYVYYHDFLWSPSRCWAEVPWVAKRSWLDRTEAEEEFGKDIAKKMVYGDPKNKDWSNGQDTLQLGKSKKAEVWEIWNKPTRCIYFIAPDSPDIVLKTVEDDPLKLEGFWPCPEPLFSTQTNDTLVPVPDYVEYQDQATELDILTQRISVVTTAIRASGVYDASFPALQRLFMDGSDNKLIPVDQWAAFAEKGGMAGAIALVPMKEIAEVLMQLYEARDHVKQDIYEITGMSDILRGATNAQETATAQEIKANYATGRLGARQEDVAEFCANVIRIAAEIVAEVFSPESLMQMSGVDQMNQEAIQKAMESAQPPPQPQGASPMPPEQQQMMLQQVKRQAAMAKQQELNGQFQSAMALLRNDKLRGFRVDIETDSTIADDMQNDKAAAVELITGVMQSLEAAGPIIAAAPEMAKPLGGMMMWAYRKYRVGRTLEAALEDALDQIDARIEDQKKQPPQPSPDQIQAQADVAVSQAKAQTEQVKAQAEQARGQADVQMAQLKMQVEQAKMSGANQAQQFEAQIAQLTLQLDAAKTASTNNVDILKAKLSFLQATTVAMITAGQATDAATINAQLESILTGAQIQHEATQNAMDRQHEAQTQAVDQQHQQTMQDNAPAAPK